MPGFIYKIESIDCLQPHVHTHFNTFTTYFIITCNQYSVLGAQIYHRVFITFIHTVVCFYHTCIDRPASIYTLNLCLVLALCDQHCNIVSKLNQLKTLWWSKLKSLITMHNQKACSTTTLHVCFTVCYVETSTQRLPWVGLHMDRLTKCHTAG